MTDHHLTPGAVALVFAGAATALLFALERLFDSEPRPAVLTLPLRRHRADTPAKLFPKDAEFQRKLDPAT